MSLFDGGTLDKMIEGWRRGSGTLFAQPFSKEARFVAFDGSVHNGPDEIAAFHQKAFDTVLKGTSLDLTVSEMKQIDRPEDLARLREGLAWAEQHARWKAYGRVSEHLRLQN